MRTIYLLHLFLISMYMLESITMSRFGLFFSRLNDLSWVPSSSLARFCFPHSSTLLISLLNSFQLVRMCLEAWYLKLDTDPYSRSLIAMMKEDYFACLHTGLLFLHHDTIPHTAFAPAWHWFMPSLWTALAPKILFHRSAVYEDLKDAATKV